MEIYVTLRRGGWRTADELARALARSTSEDDRMPTHVAWLRSYVLDERDGSVGTICIFQAESPEAIRRHAAAATLPIDEIVKVEEVIIVRPDTVPAWT